MERVLIGLAVASALAGCGHLGLHRGASADAGGGGGDTAVAALSGKGGIVQGNVKFTQDGNRVMVAVAVTGLAPNTEHGFHVHETGDCSSPDFMSAGGHFNPAGKPHGSMDMPDHHAGDMPNLKSDANGQAQARFAMPGVTIAPGPYSLVGRAVVVHADPDDYKTQPTGNSGGRIACGVIAKS